MGTTINWKLREHLHRFRDEPGDGREIRLGVLLNLILHSNHRGRTWVGRDRIAAEIGASERRVSSALQWLFEKGAIYNVPYQYRMGVECDLEPRKYVFQLTGVIRFDNDLVIPYLYLPDLESEIAHTLAELQEVGGTELVRFLTQGSDSAHLLFGQGVDTERADTERFESAHKDSTDSKDNTENPSLVGDSADVRRSSLLPSATELDKASHSGEKLVVETSKGQRVLATAEDQEEYTLFERFLMAQTRNRSLDEKRRAAFHKRSYYTPVGTVDTEQSPTVNQAWELESYREFVATYLIPEMKNVNMMNARGFDNFLNSPNSWRRYYAWLAEHAHEYGEASTKEPGRNENGRWVMQPDGSKKWELYE